MEKLRLVDTTFSKSLSFEDQAIKAIPFLVSSYNSIDIGTEGYQVLSSIKTLSRTVLSELYNRIVISDSLNKFFIMNLSDMSEIPEVLTMVEMVVDGAHLPKVPSPQLKRLWVNLTPIIGKQRSRDKRDLAINNIPRLHEMIGRGLLVMSYNDSNAWLDPKLAAFVIESYSMAVSTLIQRIYNLDPMEYKLVETLFATYYAQVMGPLDAPLDIPPLMNRLTNIGTMSEIKERLEYIADLRSDNGNDVLTPAKICDILNKRGSVRLKQLKANNLYRVFAAGSVDHQVMFNAIEYPPYWVYQILRTLSGAKNATISNLFKFGKMKINSQVFGEELVRSSQLIDVVRR